MTDTNKELKLAKEVCTLRAVIKMLIIGLANYDYDEVLKHFSQEELNCMMLNAENQFDIDKNPYDIVKEALDGNLEINL